MYCPLCNKAFTPEQLTNLNKRFTQQFRPSQFNKKKNSTVQKGDFGDSDIDIEPSFEVVAPDAR